MEIALKFTTVQIVVAVFFLIGLAGLFAFFLGIWKIAKSLKKIETEVKTRQDKSG